MPSAPLNDGTSQLQPGETTMMKKTAPKKSAPPMKSAPKKKGY
jgi:hypothetical protein